MNPVEKKSPTMSSLPSKRGFIDGYKMGYISGWLLNHDFPEERVEFKVYLDKNQVGEGIANLYREDLLLSGKGDGKCAFRTRLLPLPADGNSHQLSLVCSKTGDLIQTNNFVIAASNINVNFKGLEWGHLIGEISNLESDASSIGILLLVDNGVPLTNNGAVKVRPNVYQFQLPIPPSYMDGMPHVLTLILPDYPGVEFCYADIFPSIYTPWEHLVSSAKNLNYSSLSRAAGYRYDSLQRNTKLFADSCSNAESLSNLLVAHQVVVEGYERRNKFPKLKLPKFDSPQVSIVIPVHNKFNLTYHCIASIILAYNKASYEVIVIDDISSDETIDIDQYIDNVHVIKNKINLGFLSNCNLAVSESSGEYVVMLNNDTEVTSGWLDELLDVFSRFEGVGMSGSKLIYPDGKLQEAGGIVWGNGQPWNLGNGGNAQDSEWNYSRQVDYLSGAAIMLPRIIWDEVGGFSKEFAPAYYEDTDLAFKVRASGYKTIYSPYSVVVHFEGMSNGRDESQGIKKNQAINAPKFRSKWVDEYAHNGTPGFDNIWKNKDRNVAQRVLMIDYATPKPDFDAGSYAAVQEMRMLQANGCKITFVGENLAHMGKYTDDLQRAGVECIYAPFFTSIHQFLEKRGHEFDLVYITRFDVAERHIEHVRQYTKAKVLFNNADLHFLRELRSAIAKKQKDLSGPLGTRERELSLMRKVDGILTYNTTEQAVIQSHNLNGDNMFICPWILDARGHGQPYSARNGLAFLGGYNHLPNVEAVEYFVGEVMPLLRERLPGVSLHLYGSNMPSSFDKFACSDVILEGFVESLDEVFETCRVFIAPLLSGAGIKGKVLEAMSCGIPMVLTNIAAEGTGLSHGINAFIAATPDEWVESISKLYNDEALWNDFSKNALILAENNFSFKNGVAGMKKALEGVGISTPNRNKALVSL